MTGSLVIQIVETLGRLESVTGDKHHLRISLALDAVVAESTISLLRPTYIFAYDLVAEQYPLNTVSLNFGDLTFQHNQLHVVLLVFVQDDFIGSE